MKIQVVFAILEVQLMPSGTWWCKVQATVGGKPAHPPEWVTPTSTYTVQIELGLV